MGLRRFMVCLLFTTSCAAEAPPSSSPEVIWRAVGSWSGHGNSQTGSFTVETGALRVLWETRNESPPGAGTFRVSLHSAISGRPLQVAIDHRGPGRDTAYVQDDPRVSYLVIDSAALDWTVNVDEAVTSTVRPAK